jgi:ubiquinol-cytochrome c reductase cytochrome b subunit
VPALIIGLLTVHLAILWRQKHSQFRGPGRTERNVVGSFLYPTYAARSIGLFAGVAAVVSALGGLAQINPVWLYGPFEPAAVSTAAQPDWYVGWLEGALRIFPPWRFQIFGYTLSEVFIPGLLLPGITFGLLYLWPFIEARFTGDRLEHNLLDSPRDRPLRTAIGVGVLVFYVVLVAAGAQDIIAQKLHLGIPAVTNTLRVLLFVLPLLTAWFTWHTCRDLAEKGAREEDYPRPYPKARTPYQAEPGAREPAAGEPDAPRSAVVRVFAAVFAGVAAAVGFVLGRRRPKKIVFEDTRRR